MPPPPAWRCPRCGQGFARRGASHSCDVRSVEEFFAAVPGGWGVHEAVLRHLAALGPVEANATRTQVSYRARTRVAWLWVPSQALRRGPPDVYLAFALPRRLASPRVKEATPVPGGRWMHHVRLASPSDLDDEAKGWLAEAYHAGGAA